MGDDDQLDAYVRRGVESGLTRDQIVEAVTHLASTPAGQGDEGPEGNRDVVRQVTAARRGNDGAENVRLISARRASRRERAAHDAQD